MIYACDFSTAIGHADLGGSLYSSLDYLVRFKSLRYPVPKDKWVVPEEGYQKLSSSFRRKLCSGLCAQVCVHTRASILAHVQRKFKKQQM